MIATGPFASLPTALLESDASHGATRAYGILALLPRQPGNLIWVSQNYIAGQLRCSTRQVRNYLKELLDLGFLERTVAVHKLNRVYKLSGCPENENAQQDHSQVSQNPSEALRNDSGALEEVGNVLPTIKLNLNSNSIPNSNCRKPDSNSLLAANAESWQKEFSCFDGKEGRPTLEQKVEEAVKRFQYGDLLGYVKYYLSQGAKWLLQGLAKLQGLVTKKPIQSLEELRAERKAADAKRKAWNNRFIDQEPVTEPSEKDQAFIREGFAKLCSQMGFKRSEIGK